MKKPKVTTLTGDRGETIYRAHWWDKEGRYSTGTFATYNAATFHLATATPKEIID